MLTILRQPAIALSNEPDHYQLMGRWRETKLYLMTETLIQLQELKSFRLNPEFKAAWLDALRSGTWKQTTGHLAEQEGAGFKSYCCLGVYCMLREVQVMDERYEDGRCVIPFGEEKATTMLPRELEDEVPTPIQNILSQMNDDIWTFTEIADFIEAVL